MNIKEIESKLNALVSPLSFLMTSSSKLRNGAIPLPAPIRITLFVVHVFLSWGWSRVADYDFWVKMLVSVFAEFDRDFLVEIME
jgi:hypothetical protein